jgi:hypothetical protein
MAYRAAAIEAARQLSTGDAKAAFQFADSNGGLRTAGRIGRDAKAVSQLKMPR